MYRGSKFMISAFKFLIPIVAAVAAGVIWMREHGDLTGTKKAARKAAGGFGNTFSAGSVCFASP